MGFSIFETKKLTLIPAYYYKLGDYYFYSGVSGGSWSIDSRSPSGGFWESSSANDYIEFTFEGSIVGIWFQEKTGTIDITIDGIVIESNFDIGALDGPSYNCQYIVKEDLANKRHVIKITVKSGTVGIVGILADSRLNAFEGKWFPLVDSTTIPSISNWSAPAGGKTSLKYTMGAKQIGIFIKSSGATTISILYNFLGTDYIYDTIEFTEAGTEFIVLWSYPFFNIKLQTSNAVTLSISIEAKA